MGDFLVKRAPIALASMHEQHRKAARFFGVHLGAAEVDESVMVRPVVNHGRWIVRCPWCASAEMAGEFFFCSQGCFNGAIGRKYVRVLWPVHEKKIERILCKRLDPRTRNWTTERLADLAQENLEHGLEAGENDLTDPVEPGIPVPVKPVGPGKGQGKGGIEALPDLPQEPNMEPGMTESKEHGKS